MNTPSLASATDKSILDVRNLRVSYQSQRGRINALQNVSFTLGCEKVGIVGESGSGKSTLGRAIMGVLPETAHTEGQILFLSLIHISEPTRPAPISRMPSSA